MSSNVARFVIRLLVWLINIERRLPTLISQPYKLIWHYAFESNKFIFSLKNKPADYLMFGSGLRQLLFSRNYLCSLVRQLQTIMNRLFVQYLTQFCRHQWRMICQTDIIIKKTLAKWDFFPRSMLSCTSSLVSCSHNSYAAYFDSLSHRKLRL